MNNLHILHWNANSVTNKTLQLKAYIQKHNPHIICIQESKLGRNKQFNISGYHILRKDDSQSITGCLRRGLLMLIKNNINFQEVITNTSPIETQSVIIQTNTQPITVTNIYIPQREVISNDLLNTVIQNITTNHYIICGDWNAHHTLWGSRRSDSYGNTVESWLHDHNLVVHTDFHTHLQIATGSTSNIDLTVTSNTLAPLIECTPDHTDCIDSDHFPIHNNITLQPIYSTETRPPTWKLHKADWDQFQDILSQVNIYNISHQDTNTFCDTLTAHIIEAANLCIPKTTGKPTRTNLVPWWNADCDNAVKHKKNALAKFKRTRTSHDAEQYRRAKQHAKQVILQAKSHNWDEFVSQIHTRTKSRKIWSYIKRIQGKRSTPIPILQRTQVTDKQKANTLASTFSQANSSANHNAQFTQQQQTFYSQNKNITNPGPNTGPLNVQFTLSELDKALKNKKSTSPGADRVSYEMLKHLPNNFQQALLNLYNHIWSTNTFPTTWHNAIVVPLPKPNKDRADPSSYRPISLTSALCKTMETMVNNRLTYHLESQHLITDYQSGFRPGRSTVDQIIRLQTDIKRAQAASKTLGAVFIDLTKAFDLVWHDGLLYKINQKFGITGHMFNFIANFLRDRKIQVRVNNTLSDTTPLENGTPQGSVISPTLFNIMFSDLAQQITTQTDNTTSTFADDAAIWNAHHSQKIVQSNLQKAMHVLETWANTWGFKPNPTKTVAVAFHKTKQRKLTLTLYNTPIPCHKEVTFLGMVFDYKLNFNSHIKQLKQRCNKDLNLLRCLTGTNFGAGKQSLINIYKALILSKLDYGCQVLHNIKPTQQLILQRIQNQALRIITGANKQTNIDVLHVETGLKPLHFRREQFILRYYTKARVHGTHLPINNTIDNIKLRQEKGHSIHPSESYATVAIELNKQYNTESLHTYKYLQPTTAPWLRTSAKTSTDVHKHVTKMDPPHVVRATALQIIDQKYQHATHIYTDGSRDPDANTTGYGIYIPAENVELGYRLPSHTSVFTAELTAISVALYCINSLDIPNSVILTDSLSSVQAIQSQTSKSRPDLIETIYNTLQTAKNNHRKVTIEWVPAHVGIPGNEKADQIAKQALSSQDINTLHVSPSEIISFINQTNNQRWQKHWQALNSHTWRYQNSPKILPTSKIPNYHHTRKGRSLITRLRTGYTNLPADPHSVIKHNSSLCQTCHTPNNAQHTIIECTNYTTQRTQLKNLLQQANVPFTLKNIIFPPAPMLTNTYNALVQFLQNTGISQHI